MFQNTCLKGLKVLDLTRYTSGPTCTQILADLGAEVWKAERPGMGDETRHMGPLSGGQSSYFHSCNRNKRSFTLNYCVPEGAALVKELVKRFDVLVENNAAGKMEKYELGYETLKEINPRLIMISITGFGQKDSPYCHKMAFDGVVQAMSGLISVNGYADRPGVKVGLSIVDIITGYWGVTGCLAALHQRDLTGLGQQVDVSMMDVAVATLENNIPAYSFTDECIPRMGSEHLVVGCTNCYDTKDGPATVYINIASDKIARNLANLMGRPDLLEDPRYASNLQRAANRDYLNPIVNEWMSQYTKKELVSMMEEAGIPVGPVQTVDEVYHDPHLKERDLLHTYELPGGGKPISLVTSPLRFSDAETRKDSPAPELGEGNAEMYKELLPLSEEQLEQLRLRQII